MTDDIIRMAQEAGVSNANDVWLAHLDELERFANLVAAEWQEKCNTYMELHDAVVKDSDRLYALNAELVEALKAALSDDQPYIEKCKAALAKAQGDNNEY